MAHAVTMLFRLRDLLSTSLDGGRGLLTGLLLLNDGLVAGVVLQRFETLIRLVKSFAAPTRHLVHFFCWNLLVPSAN